MSVLLPETLPCIKQAGSVWILRQVCHDWPDQQALQILKNVRIAMSAAKPPYTLCLVEVPLTISIEISGLSAPLIKSAALNEAAE